MKEELKDKIIVRGLKFENVKINTSCYYILDLNYCGVSSSSIPRTYTLDSIFGSTLVVGSKLFIFGNPFVEDNNNINNNNDDDDDECYTYVFDLTKPARGWKIAPSPSIKADTIPTGVEFCNKIYVFRGSVFGCRCEVFDPERDEWSLISFPPKHDLDDIYIEIGPPIMADYKNDRIIVWLDTLLELHAYYPNHDRWELVAEEFRGWCPFDEQVTVVDGVVYIFDQYCKMIKAYDINTKQWYQAELPSDYESYLLLQYDYKYESLVDRGNGLLCLLGHAYRPRHPFTNIADLEFSSDYTSVVRAVEFKVNIDEADKGIHLTWLSFKNFVLPDINTYLHYLLV